MVAELARRARRSPIGNDPAVVARAEADVAADLELGRQLRGALKEAGLRVTGPRLAVLTELARATEPLSHAELVDRMAPRGMDRVTVWRNLTMLVEAGLCARTDLGDRTWRFERTGANDHAGAGGHPHFVCVACKKVSCLPEDAVYLKSGAARGSVVLEVHVKGRCDDCL